MTKLEREEKNMDEEEQPPDKRSKREGCTWVRPEEDKEYKKRKWWVI